MKNNPVPFLANIIQMAHADGKLSASEQREIEAICKECGFKKADLTAARRPNQTKRSRPWPFKP